MDKIVLASGNKKKILELEDRLVGLNCSIVPQGTLGIEDAVEDGLSFVENAIKKARHASQISGLPAIADDSGIEVDALHGQPGIYSARFAGEPSNDAANNTKLLESLQGIAPAQRSARYRCVIVFMRHALDPMPAIFSGTWEGIILEAPQGEGGFGYDPLFYCPQSQCSAAQMTAQQKQQISHRGQALMQLQSWFRAQ
ncbi:MAG: RdgB/HAM1 family non-canonical purine NTP pyrophosphatase [Gammaproteobacteria bacterium]|nr:RdgB/HAM1 family non-canonical purine NTP pyrophosphatase [Gammaproteobacteria bacterium]NVK89253.1 RdgB/HAM1 family non-canonical purine NTP pyrophosphatase [Gammaproteobacteria bacterium]